MTRLGLDPSLREAKIIINNRIIRARIISPMIKGSEEAHDLPFAFSPLARAPEPFLSACFSPAGEAFFPETCSSERAGSAEAVEPGAVAAVELVPVPVEPDVEPGAVDDGDVEVDVPATESGDVDKVDVPGEAVDDVDEPGAAVEVDAPPGAAVEEVEPGEDELDVEPGVVDEPGDAEETPVCREGCVVWAVVEEEGEVCVAGRCEAGRTIAGRPEDGRFDRD